MEFDEKSKVVEIKDKLKSLRLSYQGNKSECLKRLRDYYEQQSGQLDREHEQDHPEYEQATYPSKIQSEPATGML